MDTVTRVQILAETNCISHFNADETATVYTCVYVFNFNSQFQGPKFDRRNLQI